MGSGTWWEASQGPSYSCDDGGHKWTPDGCTWGISSLKYGGRAPQQASNHSSGSRKYHLHLKYMRGKVLRPQRALQPRIQDRRTRQWAAGTTSLCTWYPIIALILRKILSAFCWDYSILLSHEERLEDLDTLVFGSLSWEQCHFARQMGYTPEPLFVFCSLITRNVYAPHMKESTSQYDACG